MRAKNIIMMALAGILLTACKDKTYKPPTLDAMRSADKARAAWARETEEHPATVETPISRMDSTAKDSVSTLYSEESYNTSYQENDNKHPVWEKIINHPKKQKNKRVWYYM